MPVEPPGVPEGQGFARPARKLTDFNDAQTAQHHPLAAAGINVLTFDLRLPTWPFFLVAWLGDVSAVLLIGIRTYRLIFRPDEFGTRYQIKPVE